MLDETKTFWNINRSSSTSKCLCENSTVADQIRLDINCLKCKLSSETTKGYFETSTFVSSDQSCLKHQQA